MNPCQTTVQENIPCPCGSGTLYAFCCGPLISGHAEAKTALALMRSRYAAYVLLEKKYLLTTWAPAYRPEDIDFSNPLPKWLGLKIHGSKRGEVGNKEGYVDFSATYLLDSCCWTLRETSRFIRLAGKWYYQDGIGGTTRTKANRNSLCPCGSGLKFKRCCGK